MHNNLKPVDFAGRLYKSACVMLYWQLKYFVIVIFPKPKRAEFTAKSRTYTRSDKKYPGKFFKEKLPIVSK
jgi:hypothetical protein